MSAPTSPAQRGRLLLSERAIEKIAAQVAAEAAGTLRPGDEAVRPKVSVDLGVDVVDLSLRVPVPYPWSIREATERIRSYVSGRVQHLTGVRVRRVDLDVTALTVPSRSSSAARPATTRALR